MTYEELQTSREELQSTNEELQAVNTELKTKLEDITAAHGDLQNLTAATGIGILFLDAKLRIRMFTRPVAELFNIAEQDVGRAITDFTDRLKYDDIERDVTKVLRDLVSIDVELESRNHRWYMMRLRPYRTLDDRINGTVLTFVEITDRRETERQLAKSERRFRALVKASSQVLYRMSPNWDEMRSLSGGGFLADTVAPTKGWLGQYIHSDDRDMVKRAIDSAIASQTLFDFEHRVRRSDGEFGWTHSRATPIFDENGALIEWFGAATDVTDRKRAEEALVRSEERLRLALEAGKLATWDWNIETDEMAWSEEFSHMLGYRSDEVAPSKAAWRSRVHAEDLPKLERVMVEARRSGESFEAEFRTLPANGTVNWCSMRGQFVRADDGSAMRMVAIIENATERRQWDERQRVMVAELQHRTRNLLAVVRALAEQTIRSTPSLETFGRQFSDRLMALSRVQGLWTRVGDEQVTIGGIVSTELAALGIDQSDERVEVSGPTVALQDGGVQTLALAIHELATNTCKHGAFAAGEGRLRIEWSTVRQDTNVTLVLDWHEYGLDIPAPRRGAALRSGYGRELIEKALPYSLGATTTFEIGENEVRCRIELPLRGRSTS